MENENLIQHVSDTAFWIAAYRAQESARPDALFQDPLAQLLAGEKGVKIAEQMGNTKIMAWNVAVRTHLIDSYINYAISQGVQTVVNLGCGLDTRPYRLKLAPSISWIEVDFPGIIRYKTEILKNEKPLLRLERFEADLSADAVRKNILQEFDARGQKILVITEGVVPYLNVPQAAGLARDLSQNPNIKYWVVDYLSDLFVKMYRDGRIGKLLKGNTPFLFFPDDWEKFFKDCGWTIEQMKFLAKEGEALKRSSPMPVAFKVMRPFLSSQKKKAFAQMSGYALLRNTEHP